MSAGNGRSFYSRRTTNTTPRSGARSAGATPIRSIIESGINVRTYGPGQDLLDFELARPRDTFSSGSEDGDMQMQTPTTITTPLSRPRVQQNARNDDIANLFCLMQRQQATLKHHGELLEENLRQQQAQSRKLDEFEGKLLSYEEDVEAAQLNEPTKKKVKVTRELSVS